MIGDVNATTKNVNAVTKVISAVLLNSNPKAQTVLICEVLLINKAE